MKSSLVGVRQASFVRGMGASDHRQRAATQHPDPYLHRSCVTDVRRCETFFVTLCVMIFCCDCSQLHVPFARTSDHYMHVRPPFTVCARSRSEVFRWLLCCLCCLLCGACFAACCVTNGDARIRNAMCSPGFANSHQSRVPPDSRIRVFARSPTCTRVAWGLVLVLCEGSTKSYIKKKFKNKKVTAPGRLEQPFFTSST